MTRHEARLSMTPADRARAAQIAERHGITPERLIGLALGGELDRSRTVGLPEPERAAIEEFVGELPTP